MSGIANSGCFISGSLSGQSALSGELTISGGIATDIYDGEYEVSPSTKKDTILETKNKTLTTDLIVKKIQYVETSNVANGKTIYIGEDE